MKIIVGMTAVFCLGLSAPAFAQQNHKLDSGNIDRTQSANQHADDGAEVVEVANPFLARSAAVEPEARPLTVRDERTELKFGPYSRSEYAQAPGANVVQPNRGAVGLAFSLKLGG